MAKKPKTPSGSGPARKGEVVTSQLPVTRAAPRRAPSQSGDIVGGFPMDLGVGSRAAKKSTGGAKKTTKRKRMY